MPFGKHKNTNLDQWPKDYVKWLISNGILNDDNNTWEVITSSNRYVYSNDRTKCYPFVDNYTTYPTVSCDISSIVPTEIRPIYKLDNMTDITGGNDLTSRITMVSELSTIVPIILPWFINSAQ